MNDQETYRALHTSPPGTFLTLCKREPGYRTEVFIKTTAERWVAYSAEYRDYYVERDFALDISASTRMGGIVWGLS